jgi:predicted nucleic acid-binding Zn ribbon protein
MIDQEFSQKSTSLGKLERQIVGEFAEKKGLKFSVALRMIIREWHEAKLEQQPIRITEAGRAALHERKTEQNEI